jgi:hypothetical protein
MAYSFDAKSLEAEFEKLGSKEGQAVASGVPNYASGGVTMVHSRWLKPYPQ